MVINGFFVNIVLVVFLLVWLLLVIRGLSRGLIGMLLGVISWIFLIIFTSWLYPVLQGGIAGNDILVKSKEISGTEIFINKEIRTAYQDLGIQLKVKDKAKPNQVDLGRKRMCEKFYDVRTFGAVLSTGANAGQVRGAIQMTFARSVDPVVSSEHALTVCAARDEEKSYESQVGIQGRKATVPYGLYVCHGFISANLARQTGFSEEDLSIFWEALKNMFDVDRSAARGLMSAQKLIVFKHDSVLGNAPANKLFDLVKIAKKCEGAPRAFKDYNVSIEKAYTGDTVDSKPSGHILYVYWSLQPIIRIIICSDQ